MAIWVSGRLVWCSACLVLVSAMLLLPANLGAQDDNTGGKPTLELRKKEFAKKLEKSREAKRLLEEARKRISPEEAIEQMDAVRDAEQTRYFDFCLQRVTREVAEAMARFPHLTSLNLRCESLDADAAPVFATMEKLTGLHVTGQVTDEFAEAISTLPHLQQLSLNPEKLSAKGCEALTRMPMLGGVYVTGGVKGESLFAALGERSKVVNVTLWKCKLDREAVKSLSAIRHLHSLSLDENCEIEGDVVAAIGAAPSLKRLRIREGKTSLSDSQLSAIVQLTQLTELDLAYTFLTSEQLIELGNAEGLTSIQFRGEVPPAVIASFLKLQPKGCEVIQLTTESVELEGWRYTLKNGALAAESWPGVIGGLRAN